MRINKREKVFFVLIAIVVLMGVGYAYLTTNLNILGSANLSKATWDVHFENVQVTSGSVTTVEQAPTINDSRIGITYEVTLNEPGDYYEFTVDVKNSGTIDAMIENVISTINGVSPGELPIYLKYSATYSDGIEIQNNHMLNAGAKETYKIRIEYNANISPSDLPQTDQVYNISFNPTIIQKDNASATPSHPVCIRATTLHYKKNSTTITFGNLGTTGVLTPGDAFDCDVNADGVYNSENERFYYVSPVDADESSQYVVLIYYSSVIGGIPENTTERAYGSAFTSGPDVLSQEFPTTSQWSNSMLNNNITRQIKTIHGNNYYEYDTNIYNLPIFTYENRAARLLTMNEIKYACGDGGIGSTGYLNSCLYLLENTSYDYSSNKAYYWIENWVESTCYTYYVSGSTRSVGANSFLSPTHNTARPVIEVKKADVAY